MYVKSAVLASSMALLASAVPMHGHQHVHHHVEKRGDGTFPLHIHNNCGTTQSFGLFQITSDFQMLQKSDPMDLAPGDHHVLHAPFNAIGMRLSATANQGTAAQWAPQPLFEFGYSTYSDMEGTAYDLSFMPGSPSDIGVAAYPKNSQCPNKVCTTPTTCSLSSAWTNADQDSDGSPADTVCYQGATPFKIVWCPS